MLWFDAVGAMRAGRITTDSDSPIVHGLQCPMQVRQWRQLVDHHLPAVPNARSKCQRLVGIVGAQNKVHVNLPVGRDKNKN